MPAEQRPVNIEPPKQVLSNAIPADTGAPPPTSISAPENSAPPPPLELHKVANEEGWGHKIPELLEYFPKTLHNHAPILLMSLKNHQKLGEDNRVIYGGEQGAEYQGSSIIALVHYLVSPLPPNKRQNRPFDLMSFGKIMQKAAVPSNAYSVGKEAVINELMTNEPTVSPKNPRNSSSSDKKKRGSVVNVRKWKKLYR